MLFITSGEVEVVMDVPDTRDPTVLATAIAAASLSFIAGGHASMKGRPALNALPSMMAVSR